MCIHFPYDCCFVVLFLAPASIQPSTTLPPGLILLENFITDQYAMEIMASINWDTGCKGKLTPVCVCMCVCVCVCVCSDSYSAIGKRDIQIKEVM